MWLAWIIPWVEYVGVNTNQLVINWLISACRLYTIKLVFYRLLINSWFLHLEGFCLQCKYKFPGTDTTTTCGSDISGCASGCVIKGKTYTNLGAVIGKKVNKNWDSWWIISVKAWFSTCSNTRAKISKLNPTNGSFLAITPELRQWKSIFMSA